MTDTGQSRTQIELCSVVDVTPGAALKVEAAGLELAVFNVDGTFYVTDDHCTHGPGSLSEGFLDGDIIECNFHQGQFNVRTGEVVLPPCIDPVKTYRAFMRDGKVIIEL
jgi:nitrite reductase/ring-hydroxylating ferredoxin subunit